VDKLGRHPVGQGPVDPIGAWHSKFRLEPNVGERTLAA
jgi:hypothetical protein